MSIILDALRKAEASRDQRGRIGFTTLAPAPTLASVRLPRWAIPAAAGGLLCAGIAAWLLGSGDDPPHAPTAVVRQEADPAAAAPASAPTSQPAPPAPGTPPSDDASPASTAAVRGLSMEARLANPPPAGTPPGGSVEVRDLVGEEGGATPVVPGRVEVRDLLAEEGLAPPEAEAGPPGSAEAERQALENKERGLLAQEPPATPTPPLLDELVGNGQLNPPELSLDMHAYADDPAQRFVYINMRRYRIGDTTREDATVEDITPDGVVLLLQGRRFRISAR